jgi:hypothetical protein
MESRPSVIILSCTQGSFGLIPALRAVQNKMRMIGDLSPSVDSKVVHGSSQLITGHDELMNSVDELMVYSNNTGKRGEIAKTMNPLLSVETIISQCGGGEAALITNISNIITNRNRVVGVSFDLNCKADKTGVPTMSISKDGVFDSRITPQTIHDAIMKKSMVNPPIVVVFLHMDDPNAFVTQLEGKLVTTLSHPLPSAPPASRVLFPPLYQSASAPSPLFPSASAPPPFFPSASVPIGTPFTGFVSSAPTYKSAIGKYGFNLDAFEGYYEKNVFWLLSVFLLAGLFMVSFTWYKGFKTTNFTAIGLFSVLGTLIPYMILKWSGIIKRMDDDPDFTRIVYALVFVIPCFMFIWWSCTNVDFMLVDNDYGMKYCTENAHVLVRSITFPAHALDMYFDATLSSLFILDKSVTFKGKNLGGIQFIPPTSGLADAIDVDIPRCYNTFGSDIPEDASVLEEIKRTECLITRDVPVCEIDDSQSMDMGHLVFHTISKKMAVKAPNGRTLYDFHNIPVLSTCDRDIVRSLLKQWGGLKNVAKWDISDNTYWQNTELSYLMETYDIKNDDLKSVGNLIEKLILGCANMIRRDLWVVKPNRMSRMFDPLDFLVKSGEHVQSFSVFVVETMGKYPQIVVGFVTLFFAVLGLLFVHKRVL